MHANALLNQTSSCSLNATTRGGGGGGGGGGEELQAINICAHMHMYMQEQVGVSHKRQQQVTYKELASRVAEMMQGMDIRMGRKVAASAA